MNENLKRKKINNINSQFKVAMQIIAANLWNLNPRQQKAIIQCLHYAPDLVVLPELRNDCIVDAEKLFLSEGYTFFHTRVNHIMSLGIASLIAVNHSEVIDQDPFSGRPQYKLQLSNGITFLGIHLDAPVSPHRYGRRQRQLSFLAEFIKQSETPVILAGDFNTYFSESIFQRFMALIDSPQSHSSIQRPLTWPSVFPLFQIDHILCSQHLKLTQLQKGHFNGSDHLPIYGCVVRKEA